MENTAPLAMTLLMLVMVSTGAVGRTRRRDCCLFCSLALLVALLHLLLRFEKVNKELEVCHLSSGN